MYVGIFDCMFVSAYANDNIHMSKYSTQICQKWCYRLLNTLSEIQFVFAQSVLIMKCMTNPHWLSINLLTYQLLPWMSHQSQSSKIASQKKIIQIQNLIPRWLLTHISKAKIMLLEDACASTLTYFWFYIYPQTLKSCDIFWSLILLDTWSLWLFAAFIASGGGMAFQHIYKRWFHIQGTQASWARCVGLLWYHWAANRHLFCPRKTFDLWAKTLTVK